MTFVDQILPVSKKEYTCTMNEKTQVQRYKLDDETDEEIVTYMHIKTYPDGTVKKWKSRLKANVIRTFPKSLNTPTATEEIKSKAQKFIDKILAAI